MKTTHSSLKLTRNRKQKLAQVKTTKPSVLRGSIAMLAASAFTLGTAPLATSATFYWDANGLDATNNIDGTDLGGTGTWDLGSSLWWPVPAAADGLWGNAATDIAIFTSPFTVLPTLQTVTLGAASGVQAHQLRFQRSGYTLSGGDFTLAGAGAGLYAEMGESATISSDILGSAGLVKAGGGSVRLTGAKSYTGTTSIANGSLIISSAADLGGTGAVSITLNNSTPLNTGSIGFGGGSLVLDGTASGFTFARDINFEGRGPIGDRGSAILSLGNNTLSGILTSAVSPLPGSPTATFRNSRINSVNGTLTLSGTLNVNGTAIAPGTNGATATTVTTLGGLNAAGVGIFNLTGVLAGTSTLEKSGAGTLFLNPSSTSGFTGNLRISGSATGGQSTVRVTQLSVGGTSIFGAGTTTEDASAIDMNGGLLEFRNNGSLDFNALSSGKNVYLRASSTIFTGPAAGGAAINGVTSLGALRVDRVTGTFESRNGFAMSLGTWTQERTDGNNAIANNGGGTLTFTGAVWNNNSTAARNLTFSGDGNTRIVGSITATDVNKQVFKSGAGELAIQGVASSFTGVTNIQGGAVRITDFRSVTNNTVAISLGNAGTTAGALIIGGSGVGTATAAGLTTSKPIILNTTSAANSIVANQGAAFPVILNGAITKIAGATTGNLNLGGSSTQDNIVNVVIPVEPTPSTGGLTKTGLGTWVLNAANTYLGVTTIQGGVLKLRGTAAVSDVIASTAALTFTSQATSQIAGGTLEFNNTFAGAATETLGALTATAGAGTVRLVGNGANAANLTFTSLGATTAASSMNFVTTGAVGGLVTITGQAATNATTLPGTGNFQGHLYLDGANFATINASAQVIAPAYGGAGNFRDAGPALVAATHNRMTAATASGALTISSLATNNQTLTLSGNLVVSTGGILQSGGTASILSDSATSRLIQGGVAGTNVAIRVNLLADVLNLGSATNPVNISSTTTAGLTKNGAGTLVVFGTNAQTGATTINEGKVTLSGANSRLSATNANLVIRQGASLDLNGATAANAVVNNLDGSATATITNVNATATTFTENGGGTWKGTFAAGAGVLNITKGGGSAATWSGLSTYTGITTIGGTGLVTVDTLAIGGSASAIGASPSAATNLVFTGSTSGIDYRGSIVDDFITLGSRSATTDRLFTLASGATGAILSSSVTLNNAIIWSSTGAIVNNTAANATLTLSGASAGDNTFNPLLGDSSVGGGVTLGLTKSGAGQWNLGNSANTYTGLTTIADGILGLNDNGALPANSSLVLGATTTSGILQMSGSFARTLIAVPVAGPGTITFGGTTGGGGFAAHGAALSVTLNSGAGLTWGSGGFVGTGGVQTLFLNSASSLADVTFTNAIDLGAAIRTVSVNDNLNTGADYANLTGVLSGAGGGLLKIGAGILRVGNANSYTGTTGVEAGTLVVSSLGLSGVAGTSSVGAVTVGAFDDTNAVVLGNATTGGGILQYVGPGETSDRKIRLRGTTAANQIHADGSGALILTNVKHDTTETGNKTLFLRGSSAAGNTITSQLSNNAAGVLSVTVDGGATWILTNATNNYTGATTASGGALGIGDNAALAAGTLTNSNGNVFAYGADRTLANALTLSDNTTNGWLGDYSLTFSTAANLAAAGSNVTTTNSIVAGEALIFNSGVTANALTADRVWAMDGPGETVINGNFTSSTAFGVRIDINGGGTVTLGTSGAGSDWNKGGLVAANVDRGTLKFTVNDAIPTALATSGGLELSPELATADTATVQLNGTNQTITTLSAITDGTAVIDNNAAGAVTLTVGAQNGAVTFGTGGAGTYSITQSGGGAINLTKIGTGAANFTGTLGNTGTVTSSGGGVLNINSASIATAAVGNGGAVNFKGGFTTPANLLSVTTDNGGLVSFASGLGTPFTGLTGLSLSVTANSSLELDAGDSGTDTLTTANAATVANVTTLIIKDIDLSNLTTYNLLVDANGGLGVLGNYALNLPGYTGSLLVVSPTLVQLTTGTLVTSDVFWNNGTGIGGGTLTQAWNTVDGVTTNINFSSDVAGATTLQTNANLPGKGQKVIFQADNLTTGLPLVTTLEQGFTINALEFRASTATGSTSRTISIAPGSVASNSLTVKPSATTDGINLQTGAVGTVTISAPYVAGSDQTWTVADAPIEFTGGIITGTTNVQVTSTTGLLAGMTVTGTGITAGTTILAIVDGTNFTLSAAATNATVNILAAQQLNMTGAVSGAGDVIKAGPGKVVLSGANGTLAGTYTNNAGITQVNTLSAFGGLIGVPGSGTDITVTGGSFFYNGAAATFVNDIALNGGTLASGGGNQTYSGNVNVSANSTVSLRDQAATTSAFGVARNVTLSGVVSGASSITIDAVNTVAAGNQVAGALTLNNAANTWNGDLLFNAGSVFLTSAATPSFTTNDVTFNAFGRLNLAGADASTLTRTGTLNFGAGAVGEVGLDNAAASPTANYTVDQSGLVTLGAGGTGATARFFLAPDNFSNLTLTGGVALDGNSSITVSGGDADSLVTISGTGISGTGNLAINDEAGAWAQTSTRLAINAAGSYIGNTTLNEGILLLGHKDALSTGSLTITGASTITPTIDLSTVVPNSLTLSAALTVTGANNLTFGGAATTFIGTAGDANRTLTNSLTAGTLVINSTTGTIGAAGNLAGRTLTIAGAGNTTISSPLGDGNAFANGLTKTGAGTLTLSNTNLYTGTTTLSSGAGVNNGVILATANNALGTGLYTSVQNTAALTIGQLQLSGGITLGNSALTTSGPGSDGTVNGIIRSVSGANIITGPVNQTGGGGSSFYRADTGASLTFSGNVGGITAQISRIVTLFGGGDFTFSGVIQDTNDASASTVGLSSGNTGTTTLSGATANTYTLLTTVSAGTLQLNKTAGVNAIAGSGLVDVVADVLINGGTLKLLANNQIADTVTISQTSGAFRLNGKTETIGTYTKTGGLFSLGIGGSLTSLGNTFTVTGPSTLGDNVIDAEANLTDASVNLNSGAILEVYGANNAAYSPGPFGTFGGTLQIDAAGTGLTFGAGTNTVNLDSDASTGSAGRLLLKGNVSTTGTGTAAIDNVLGGSSVAKGYIDLDGGARSFTVAATNPLGISAVVTNGSLTKAGLGTLSLTAANTYAGTTLMSAGTIVAGDNAALGTSTATFDGGALASNNDARSLSNTIVVNAVAGNQITGSNSLTLTGDASGAGTLNVNLTDNTKAVTVTPVSSNGFAPGEIQLTSGSLLLGASSVIGNSTAIDLNGGTLNTNAFSEGTETTVGLGALTLSTTSTIDFGTGTVGTLTFDALPTFTAGVLNILNWTGVPATSGTDGTHDRLIFAGTTTDFTGQFTQAAIDFSGFGAGYSAIQFSGGFYEIVPVPEPATTAAIGALALCALIGYRERRRIGTVYGRLAKKSRA